MIYLFKVTFEEIIIIEGRGRIESIVVASDSFKNSIECAKKFIKDQEYNCDILEVTKLTDIVILDDNSPLIKHTY